VTQRGNVRPFSRTTPLRQPDSIAILSNMTTTTNTNLAAALGAGTCWAGDLAGFTPGEAVIVGRSAKAGTLGTMATYLGHTLDGYAVVRIDGCTVDMGAGPGVEEWLPEQLASLAVVA